MLGLLGLKAGLSIITTVISVAYVVLQIIANWTILEKAGEKGWKSLIPFYGEYTLYKIVWQPKMYWIYLILSVVQGVFNYLSDNVFQLTALGVVFTLIYVVFMLLALALNLFFCRKLAFSFGKSSSFAIGLFFLYPIFSMILAFGNSRYIGKSGPTNYL